MDKKSMLWVADGLERMRNCLVGGSVPGAMYELGLLVFYMRAHIEEVGEGKDE